MRVCACVCIRERDNINVAKYHQLMNLGEGSVSMHYHYIAFCSLGLKFLKVKTWGGWKIGIILNYFLNVR